MKKFVSALLAAALAASLAACGSTPASAGTDGSSAAGPTAASYTVGICQLVQHDALDAATQGFKDALTEKLGDAVKFEEGNASGDSANCSTIVNGFLSTGDNWTGTVGTNVSGTSDLAPLDEQAAMLNEMFPDAGTVGLLYCSAEPNSVYQCTQIESYLQEYGYTVEWFAFTDTNDVASVTQAACDACDVIYIPTDNTAASNTEAIANVVLPAGVPVIAGEEGICRGCGVATLSIDYYDLGYATGEMAYEILTYGADVSTMPVGTAASATKKYNAANCEALNITPPEGYEAIAEA